MSPILKPNTDAMLQHLTMLFGRALEGRIEITAINVDKAGPRPRTGFFSPDELEEATAYAAEANSEPGWNVYVGAALRRDDVFPGKAADDDDVLKTYALWADADTPEQLKSAREACQASNVRPHAQVMTGRTPHNRAQFWFPLETPISDLATIRATVRGIATALGTDMSVCTAKQLMRLAGSLAWPKPNKPGRVLEVVEIIVLERGARENDLEALTRAYPPITRGEGAAAVHSPPEPVATLAGALAVRDLRSALASMRADDRDLWIRLGHGLKTLGEQGRGLWLEWSQTSDKYDAADAARVWDSFQPNHTDHRAVFAEAQRQGWVNPGRSDAKTGENYANSMQPRHDPETGDIIEDDNLFEVLSIADLKSLPEVDWIVDEAIPRGGLGFVYGAPGSYKSFVCYDLALSLAYGKPSWIDRPVKHAGSVLYLASEGSQGAKNRITAWQRANSVEADDGAFRLIRTSISFMRAEDIDKLERTVAAVVAASGPIDTVFVDTVSRVLPGADENLQKDMTLFVAACDRLRERFGATVIGVHHTNKNGDMRGSTVFLGQGDFVFRLDKDEDGHGGVLTCEKQKEAEDGWKLGFGVDVQAWLPVGRIKEEKSLSVKWTGASDVSAPKSKWPSRDVLRAFQTSIEGAFLKGLPLSLAPQAKRDGRHAPSRLSAAHDVPAAEVQQVLETWLANEVITVEMTNSHSKTRGLKVAKWLD